MWQKEGIAIRYFRGADQEEQEEKGAAGDGIRGTLCLLILIGIVQLGCITELRQCLKAWSCSDGLEGRQAGAIYEREQLGFDMDGNLIMVTHDKKATTNVTYKTLGFVIKRYDMPMEAAYQQYVILPVGDEVQILQDTFNENYVYCRYCVREGVIAEAVRQVSQEWYQVLYTYGEDVFIDEIMTVTEQGRALGGLTEQLVPYGEVYFQYEGIAAARPWASRESLKTHFDKRVYFRARRVVPYDFRYEEAVVAREEMIKDNKGSIRIDSGTRYRSDHLVSQAVPTGASLCFHAQADSLKYRLCFEKRKVDFYIPIKVVAAYDLRWKGYDGSERSERKQVEKWYYVKRTVSYYTIGQMELKYLSEMSVNNYALQDGGVTVAVQGNRPVVDWQRYGSYFGHVTFPAYSETVYVEAGEVKEMTRYGVKPVIPEQDFKHVAEAQVGNLQVNSDRLVINRRMLLSDEQQTNNGKSPVSLTFSTRKLLYYGGYIIPHERQNRTDNPATGCFVYQEVDSGKRSFENVEGIDSVTIHTPVYVEGVDFLYEKGLSGRIAAAEMVAGEKKAGGKKESESKRADETNAEEQVAVAWLGETFRLKPITYGKHLERKGYGTRDYESMIGRQQVQFSCAVCVNGQNMEAGRWFDFDEDTIFSIPFGTAEEEHEMGIRVFAKNYPRDGQAVEQYVEDTANLSPAHYVAQAGQRFVVKTLITKAGAEVTGTH